MPTILRAIIGYFVLLLVVRVLKRRAGAQMTLFEFVLIFLIGGVVILSTVGEDRSVTNCTCAVIAVALIHRTLAWAKSKNPRLGALLDGTPLIIINKGEWQQEVAEGMYLRHEDLEAAARSANIPRVEDIDYAILERNGSISVFPKEQ
ncbi:MAG TPA: YetF domain-containing protein [Acidobacteriaceae bacterium]|nr:YetF domain-containing protein [Acidobacteriaceae bacterium]